MDVGYIADEQEMMDCPIVLRGKGLWEELHQILGKHSDIDFESFLKKPECKLQHALLEKLHENLLGCIIEEADAGTVSRIHSAGGKGSGFLIACPTIEALRSPNDHMEISVKRRLGIKLSCLVNPDASKCVCGGLIWMRLGII